MIQIEYLFRSFWFVSHPYWVSFRHRFTSVFLLFIHLTIGKRFPLIGSNHFFRRQHEKQPYRHLRCKFPSVFRPLHFHVYLWISRRLLVPFDEPTTFTNLALLITFTLALVQALLSMIGAVISCLWSPCCIHSSTNSLSIATNSHYSQTTPHRFEVNSKITIFFHEWIDLHVESSNNNSTKSQTSSTTRNKSLHHQSRFRRSFDQWFSS